MFGISFTSSIYKILIRHSLILSIFVLIFSFSNSYAVVSKRVKFAENNPISDTMCKVYYAVTGTVAKVVATFVIMIIALGFFLGKVSWGIVISAVIAISLLFSGRVLLTTFIGPKADSGCECKKGTYGYSQNCTAKPIDSGT
jgi:type IV secretory pathway VirB2 component (pilin)